MHAQHSEQDGVEHAREASNTISAPVESSSMTTGSRSRASIIDARASRKSPPRIASLLPNEAFNEGTPEQPPDNQRELQTEQLRQVTSPGSGFVDHIVVQQARSVNHLAGSATVTSREPSNQREPR